MPKPSAMPEVLSWLVKNADPDGFVSVHTGRIARELSRPRSTVQHTLKRAEDTGIVVQLEPNRYAVVHLAQNE